MTQHTSRRKPGDGQLILAGQRAHLSPDDVQLTSRERPTTRIVITVDLRTPAS
ncbi:MAG: hypothetical protein ACRCZP_17400 [Phycicoccus sp.]